LCQNPPLETGNVIPLRPWIRSSQYGRRVLEAKDKKYYSNPSHANDFGYNSPPAPESLLQQLEDMKIHQPTPMESAKSHQQTSFQKSSRIQPMSKAIQGVPMKMAIVNSYDQGSSSTSSKRQRTEDTSPTHTEMA
jgi:hypothetical protein